MGLVSGGRGGRQKEGRRVRRILVCNCNDTPKFAEESFSLLFPNLSTPKVIAGDTAINAFADILPPKTEACRYIRGIANNKERFAIYLDWDDSGNIRSAYNLLTGKKIQ